VLKRPLPLADWLKMKNPAAPCGEAWSGRGLGQEAV